MEPLVSILIPAFKAEQWIADTLRSALGQSWPRREIIVVDDGSPDRTADVARGFACKEVSVVTQANQGAAAARNKAYSLAQGEYIQWLDADDLLSPDKIARQLEALREGAGPRTLLSSAWGYFAYRPRRARFCPTSLWKDLSPADWLVHKLGENLHMQTATWLVSRQLTEAAGPWNTRLLGDDDGEYFCRVLMASEGTRFVPEAKVYYRMSPSNRLSYIGRSDKKMEAQFVSMKLHIKYVRSLEESARVREACVKYLRNWLPEFYPERLDLFGQAQELATELGGRLEAPRPPWEYAWIQKCFGWTACKQARLTYNQWKSSAARAWDKALYLVEGKGAGTG